MVVEDEGVIARDIKKTLEKEGYSVPATVSSGDKVIEMVSKTHPDLILMDIMIEGSIDGVEAAGQVQERFDIPVVYLTAYGDDSTLQRARITEPYGYILKPYESRELHVAIEIALYKHKMERKLKESEQWLATTLGNIGDAVIVADMEGLIMFMNPAAEGLTGWIQKDALGNKLNEVCKIVDKQSHVQISDLVKKALQNSIVSNPKGNTILIARNKKEIFIDYSAALNRDKKRGVIGVVLNFRDITEYKRMEDQIREYNEDLKKIVEERTTRIKELERQRMENEKLAITGRMAARVAHEINNPLAGIQYSFLLIKDSIPGNHPHYEYVGRIEKEIKRISSIVRQMLDLSRPSEQKRQEFNINTTIRDVVAMLKVNCDKLGVSVNYNTCSESLKVYMLEDSLRQVLFNIVQNAIDASPEGEEINITLKADSDHLKIMVADKGSGIPDELQYKIFEPFFSTKGKIPAGGLGLGLSICKGMMDIMGGSLGFKSKENEGTVFIIELPISVVK
jgi:PAS domain S-box-containing protein